VNWKPVLSLWPAARRLLKTQLKPHLKDCRCISPQQNGVFAAPMEDVLAVYARPSNQKLKMAGGYLTCSTTRLPANLWFDGN
jgi:hypothetical protein